MLKVVNILLNESAQQDPLYTALASMYVAADAGALLKNLLVLFPSTFLSSVWTPYQSWAAYVTVW